MCGVVFSCKTGDNKAVADCEITAPFDSLFSTIFTDPGAPGGVVIVCRGDSVVYNRSFGMADLDKNIPMSDSTMFNVASASKTYITSAVIKLRDNGLLSLDDSLSRFFPEFNREVFDKVKLRHVLSHTTVWLWA